MKRIFTLIALLVMIVTAGMAQRPLVTLSHNGELSFFSNLRAFEDALDSAKNGDIIYLSEGKFTSAASDITINKRLSIVGCGYKSHIVGNITIDMYANSDSWMDAPLFEGVRLQELEFSNSSVSRDNLKEVTLRKCWINKLGYAGSAGSEFLVDRCKIETFEPYGCNANNTIIQNSKIGEITSNGGDGCYIQIINCNVEAAYYCPRMVFYSIINSTLNSSNLHVYGQSFGVNGTHTIYNSLIRSTALVNSEKITTYGCYFPEVVEGEDIPAVLDENLEPTMNLLEMGYLGEDGSVVGCYGGEFPFTENPTVPTVDSAKSSVEYDPDTNKLNVKITVAPN